MRLPFIANLGKTITASMLLWGVTLWSAQAEIYDAKQMVLDNGMQVVVVENHRAPVVTHMVWYRVGAMDEPPGKSGIAHSAACAGDTFDHCADGLYLCTGLGIAVHILGLPDYRANVYPDRNIANLAWWMGCS